jgi:hypothetical protein
MTRKAVKDAIDKRSLYLPRPQDWDFYKLSDLTIRDRLVAARATRERLEGWAVDLQRQRDEGWQALKARLPEAKLYETKVGLARLEDAGKQLADIQKMLKQVTRAIEYIEERTGAGVTK